MVVRQGVPGKHVQAGAPDLSGGQRLHERVAVHDQEAFSSPRGVVLQGRPEGSPLPAPLTLARAALIMKLYRSLPPLLPWRHAHGDPNSATLGG